MPQATLQQVRRTAGRALDDLTVHGVVGSTTTTVSLSGLTDTTPNASANRFDGAYVYGCTSGQQRWVQTGGFVPSTGVLTFEVAVTPFAVSSDAEITRAFPCASNVVPDTANYQGFIQRAAARLLVPDRITVSITTSETYSLARPWLDRPERLLRILEPSATGGMPVPSDWRGWRLTQQAGAPVLEVATPFLTASGSLTLEVLRPADTRINGTEVAGGSGMVIDTDYCNASIEELTLLTLMEAYQALSSRNPGRPGNWEAKYQDTRERAEKLYHFDGQFYAPRTVQPAAEVAA